MTSRYEAAAFVLRDLRQQADYLANPSLNRTLYSRKREPGARQRRSRCAPGLRRLPPRAGQLKRWPQDQASRRQPTWQ